MRARLSGPMPSLKTPFNRDGSIDYDGLRNLIDCNLAAGAKALMLTAGDSHYVALSEQEIAEVTLATIRHTAGRALVIAADRYYHTTQAFDSPNSPARPAPTCSWSCRPTGAGPAPPPRWRSTTARWRP
jgi:hypothetical protein